MKERYRDRRGLRWVEDLARDVRLAVRGLRRQPGFACVAVLTLAVGIGANTALFSAVNEYLWKPLAVRAPEELVTFRWVGPNTMASTWATYAHIAGSDGEAGTALSFSMLDQIRASNRTLSEVFAFAPSGGLHVFDGGSAELATGYFVSGHFHDALGTHAVAGRMLRESDDVASAPAVAVISEQYWRRRFGRDPQLVGRSIAINNTPVTVVGIAPAEAVTDLTNRGALEGPDVLVPLTLEPRMHGAQSMLRDPAAWWLVVMGRLAPGATSTQVAENFQDVFEQSARAGWLQYVASLPPERRSSPVILRKGTQVPRLVVAPATYGIADASEEDLDRFAMFAGIFGIALLIVCVNLASLLLARGAARQRDVAVRAAIGASRARLVRQLLAEGLVLGVLGGLAGWPIAWVCRRWLPDSLSAPMLTSDAAVVMFAGALAVTASLALALFPALRLVRRASLLRLPAGSRISLSWSAGKPLVAVQVALSLVLVAGAVLFSRTLWNLQRVPLGFETDHLVTFSMEPGLVGYTRDTARELYVRVAERLRRIPGVQSVATAGIGSGLMWGTDMKGDVFVEGASQPYTREGAKMQAVDPGVFETMGIQVVRGRAFTPLDVQTAPLVAVVTEAFARTFFGNADPIGRRFSGSPLAPAARQIEIVGLARDVRTSSLRTADPLFFRPIAQMASPSRTIVVRTVTDAEGLVGAVAAAMREIDPRLPLRELRTQRAHIAEYAAEERLLAVAALFFGGLATLVSTIGLFGLMAYSVTQRTTEIGVRLAIGAQPARLLRTVMGEALVIVGAGIVLGAGASIAASRFTSSYVFGIEATDAASIGAAALLMVAVGALAAWFPARRAARVDPIVALRSE
jgi:predicted permease